MSGHLLQWSVTLWRYTKCNVPYPKTFQSLKSWYMVLHRIMSTDFAQFEPSAQVHSSDVQRPHRHDPKGQKFYSRGVTSKCHFFAHFRLCIPDYSPTPTNIPNGISFYKMDSV